MHSFMQQIFIQYLLCIRFCSKSSSFINDKTEPCLLGVYLIGVNLYNSHGYNAVSTVLYWQSQMQISIKTFSTSFLISLLSLPFLSPFILYCPWFRTVNIFKLIQHTLIKHLLIWQHLAIFKMSIPFDLIILLLDLYHTTYLHNIVKMYSVIYIAILFVTDPNWR